MWKLVGKGSRRGSTLPDRASDIVRRPTFWAGVSAALTLAGPRGRRAALRGSACYGTAALIHLLIKPIVGRSHPRGGALMQMGFGTSSFPSGHAASDLALTLGASQEIPLLFLPLSAATVGAHWALVRGREHYPSDVVGGGAIAIAVAAAAWRLWPPGGAGTEEGNPRAES
ncbi:MAG: phosphatase PAP2 family protein [Actinomycetota bacterium]|nr:phosphatase PAP2 family protein [Actinomycetota bacterium]